jgi:hypothetical protein
MVPTRRPRFTSATSESASYRGADRQTLKVATSGGYQGLPTGGHAEQAYKHRARDAGRLADLRFDTARPGSPPGRRDAARRRGPWVCSTTPASRAPSFRRVSERWNPGGPGAVQRIRAAQRWLKRRQHSVVIPATHIQRRVPATHSAPSPRKRGPRHSGVAIRHSLRSSPNRIRSLWDPAVALGHAHICFTANVQTMI